MLDDGASVYDSRVICEHLDGIAPEPKLFPAGGPERLVALRHRALRDGSMDHSLPWPIERQRGAGMISEPLVAACRRRLERVPDRLESEVGLLRDRPYDIGHLTTGCALGHLDFRFADQAWREGQPQLAARHADFVRRPSVVANPVVDDSRAGSAVRRPRPARRRR